MKQMVVDWLIEKLTADNLLCVNDEDYNKFRKVLDEGKKLEEYQTCHYGAKCCVMTTQKKEWSLETLYKETFKK